MSCVGDQRLSRTERLRIVRQGHPTPRPGEAGGDRLKWVAGLGRRLTCTVGEHGVLDLPP